MFVSDGQQGIREISCAKEMFSIPLTDKIPSDQLLGSRTTFSISRKMASAKHNPRPSSQRHSDDNHQNDHDRSQACKAPFDTSATGCSVKLARAPEASL